MLIALAGNVNPNGIFKAKGAIVGRWPVSLPPMILRAICKWDSALL
jgi:hypothetical protein